MYAKMSMDNISQFRSLSPYPLFLRSLKIPQHDRTKTLPIKTNICKRIPQTLQGQNNNRVFKKHYSFGSNTWRKRVSYLPGEQKHLQDFFVGCSSETFIINSNNFTINSYIISMHNQKIKNVEISMHNQKIKNVENLKWKNRGRYSRHM